MAEANDLIVVGADGSVRAAGRGAERRLRDRAGTYRLTVDTPGVLVLRREREEKDTQAARVLMAGEVINKMTMLEVINVIANSNWRGDMLVYDAEGFTRAMVYDQGAMKFARSNHPDDLLGEVLYRQGILTRDQLDQLLRMVGPGKRLGQLCLDHELLDQDQLFQNLRRQAEQIFYGALLVSDGTYAFCSIDERAVPPALTIHIPIQGMLMEGVQRIDEMSLFRERIPSSGMVPEPKTDAPERQLDGPAMTVLAYCDGVRSIDDIARETGLGEFHTTKTIYHLLQQRQIELHASAKIDEEAIRGLVRAFNDVMRDIFMAVATYGGIDETRHTLSTWIQGSGYTMYFGAEVEEDGSINGDHVLEVFKLVQTDHPIETLHQALHELAAFALFSATTNLPRGQELSLTRDVNRRLKAIRL